jgi:hypothetical protein
LRVTKKSTWWGTERNPQRRLLRRSSERLKRKLFTEPAWPRKLKKKKSITACRMTQVHQRTSLGVTLP